MSTQLLTQGPLFELVQLLRLFNDSKAFPDSKIKPPYTVAQIEAEFEAFLDQFPDLRSTVTTASTTAATAERAVGVALNVRHLTVRLSEWVTARFELPAHAARQIPTSPSMEDHLEVLWAYLTRQTRDYADQPTLLQLPHPFVVPGGRYIEQYYWDTYFSCVGLKLNGHMALVNGMAENFAVMIDRFGYIPNGNRTYYEGRSQPPFFAQMIRLIDDGANPASPTIQRLWSALQTEYDYWMQPTDPAGKCVTVAGSTLNRYWDRHATPRPEGYWEDITTALEAGLDPHLDPRSAAAATLSATLYRHLRAGAESGWDYTSRWLQPDAEGRYLLATIRTTAILPVDLNALLFQVETTLAELAPRCGAPTLQARYQQAALARKQAILTHFWDAETGWFMDRTLADLRSTGVYSLAGIVPLFCRVLDPVQDRAIADRIAAMVESRFLQAGGVVTSLHETGQQWDWPNGWAPLQWMTVMGLHYYGYDDLAREIALRFTSVVRSVYVRTGKMMEKYDVCQLGRSGGGGEYPNQEGFGWTNGVVVGLLQFLEDPSRF